MGFVSIIEQKIDDNISHKLHILVAHWLDFNVLRSDWLHVKTCLATIGYIYYVVTNIEEINMYYLFQVKTCIIMFSIRYDINLSFKL